MAKNKTTADDGKHTAIAGLAHHGMSIFGYVGGFGNISWREVCKPQTEWIEVPSIPMEVKECNRGK